MDKCVCVQEIVCFSEVLYNRAMINPMRYERLLLELPKHNFKIEKAAVAAGFAKTTARTQQKRLIQAALKIQAQRALELANMKASLPSIGEVKSSMASLVGMSVNEVMGRLKTIANQDKDLGSALKVLAPLAKEHGVVLQQDEQSKVVVPILNVSLGEKPNNVAQNNDIPEQLPSM